MRPNQIIVLAVAVIAGIGAMLMLQRDEAPVGSEQAVVMKVVPAETTDILIANSDLPMWQILRDDDLRWQPWPSNSIPEGAFTRSEHPNADTELRGMMTRSQFAGGEPLRAKRLMESSAESGFMSAILPPGKRALAITIDTRGATSAGGFIHPNDRVDIIRIYREEERSEDRPTNVFYSETILTNIRVLAIGQSVETDSANVSLHADTATVEVTPAEAEALSLAQRTGHLTLSLRSFADAKGSVVEDPAPRAVTVTAGGGSGFSTSRFVVAQPPQINVESPGLVAQPSFGMRPELASANWLDRQVAR